MTILFASFDKQDQKQRIEIYCRMLKDIPQDVLQKVVEKTIYENKFLPSIAEIVEACRSLTSTASGEREVPDWNEAWAEVEKAMRDTPWGGKPKFSHPAIEQAVKNYGWKSIHEVMADDYHTMQAQLRRVYDEVAKRFIENKRNNIILQSDAVLAQGKTLALIGER
jgi:hypothetical protein